MVATSRKPRPKSGGRKPAPEPAPKTKGEPGSVPEPGSGNDSEAASAPVPAPESRAAAGRSEPPEARPENLRALYDHLLPHLGRWRVEAINGRLVVSPVGTPEHGRHMTRLVRTFGPVADDHGWDLWAGTVDVCLPTREPYEPDFVMAPRDAPRWDEREIITDGLVMVGEVVSKGSTEDDRRHKPGIYARGGVPIMLLIDPLCQPPAVTVYSDLKDGRYSRTTSVEMGEKLHIPEPVDFDLDTSIFLEE